jgi:hypothetical protein
MRDPTQNERRRQKYQVETIHRLLKTIATKLNEEIGYTNVFREYMLNDELIELFDNDFISEFDKINSTGYCNKIYAKLQKQLTTIEKFLEKGRTFETIKGVDGRTDLYEIYSRINKTMQELYGNNEEGDSYDKKKFYTTLEINFNDVSDTNDKLTNDVFHVIEECFEEFEMTLQVFDSYLEKKKKFINEIIQKCKMQKTEPPLFKARRFNPGPLLDQQTGAR